MLLKLLTVTSKAVFMLPRGLEPHIRRLANKWMATGIYVKIATIATLLAEARNSIGGKKMTCNVLARPSQGKQALCTFWWTFPSPARLGTSWDMCKSQCIAPSCLPPSVRFEPGRDGNLEIWKGFWPISQTGHTNIFLSTPISSFLNVCCQCVACLYRTFASRLLGSSSRMRLRSPSFQGNKRCDDEILDRRGIFSVADLMSRTHSAYSYKPNAACARRKSACSAKHWILQLAERTKHQGCLLVFGLILQDIVATPTEFVSPLLSLTYNYCKLMFSNALMLHNGSNPISNSHFWWTSWQSLDKRQIVETVLVASLHLGAASILDGLSKFDKLISRHQTPGKKTITWFHSSDYSRLKKFFAQSSPYLSVRAQIITLPWARQLAGSFVPGL